jgi:hypothetical protein
MVISGFIGLGGQEILVLLALAAIVGFVLVRRGRAGRALLVLSASLGAAALAGGLLAFVFGAWVLHDPIRVSGLGPFDGVWSQADYCFLGAVLSAAGAGLATCGLLGLRPRGPA